MLTVCVHDAALIVQLTHKILCDGQFSLINFDLGVLEMEFLPIKKEAHGVTLKHSSERDSLLIIILPK